MIRYLTFLPLLLGSYITAAQQVTISGYISDQKSGERLIGATVYVPEKNAGTATNAFGFYSLTLPADSFTVFIAALGYETDSRPVQATKNIAMDVSLRTAQKNQLKEVTVTGKEAIQNRTQMSSIDLPINTIKSLPAFLGEVDILKAIQLLPGVQAGSEGSSGLYVRGGSADQNLILLDGVPVYNASHLFGFFSVFNADAIKSVEVTKGGFPARYAGRLSSVIDINMKEGDKNDYHAEGGVGIVASRLTVEGPIQKGKSSFMLSGRRTYIDALAKPLLKDDVGYYFYDLNGKINFKLGRKDHLYLSGYFGNDKFHFNEEYDNYFTKAGVKWGNATGVMRWNHQFGPQTFGNLTAYYARYKFGVTVEDGSTADSLNNDNFKLAYTSGIEDVALKYDIDYRPGAAHNIRAGISAISHNYTPGAMQMRVSLDTTRLDQEIYTHRVAGQEYDVYVEDDIRFTSKLKANIGLHGTGFYIRSQLYTSLQPRLSARYLLSNELSIKASYAQMNQFIHLLTNSSIGLPTDLWVPATDRVPPMKSSQVAAGIAYMHPRGYEVSVEGYYKTMDNVIEYKEGAAFTNPSVSWEDKIVSGKGWSYGGELFIQKKKGRFTGMLGYTLSWTNRKFDKLNEGKTFPYRYDRRHDFKIAGVYNLSPRVEISAEWVYGTGNAITLPISAYRGPDGSQVTIYGERNGYRMQAYHRGDVSVKFIRQKKRYERAWVLGVYNIYNRANPFYIYQTSRNGKSEFRKASLFPVIPSISYQFKF